jgi:hypothetical protein
MSETAKTLLIGALLLVALVTSVFWYTDPVRPTLTWTGRIGSTTLAVLILGILVWAALRKDKAPDLLRELVRRPFGQAGFCFAIIPAARDGTRYLDLYYQNRYARACRAVVVLKPVRGFFLNRPDLACFSPAIDCPGGAFGVITLPWGIPQQFQGQKQWIDVAADVSYPGGRGRMLRFKDGLTVGSGGSAGAAWRMTLTIGAALAGHIHLTRPAQLRLKLPTGVRETVPTETPLINQVLWSPAEENRQQEPTGIRATDQD